MPRSVRPGRRRSRATRAVVCVVAMSLPVPGHVVAAAQPDPVSLCEAAARDAAAATAVPISVLRAIMLAESGRARGGQLQPWPWTINMEGKGRWFASESAARAYVDEHFRRGARSFDVGCFQINYKWHHAGFESLDEMFDPAASALYAARFLKALFSETGDWTTAAGAYHSRTPKHAEPYTARFAELHARITGAPAGANQRPAPQTGSEAAVAPQVADTPAAVRRNSYPLLQAQGRRGLGSLVPLRAGAGAGLFAPTDGG